MFDAQNPAHYMVSTTIGIVRTEDAGESWSWICAPAFGAQGDEVHPTLALDGWNTILVGHAQGLAVSRDGGCSFASIDTFAGRIVQQIEHTHDGSRLIAITASWDSPNGLYVSDDHGQSWSLSGELHLDMQLSKLLVSPLAPGPIYVAGTEITDSGAEIPETLVYVSSDNGGSWQALPYPLAPGETGFRLLGLDPSRPTTVYASSISNRTIRLMKSEDGAHTWRQLEADPRGFVEFAASGDGRKVFVGSDIGLSRSLDGGETFEPPVGANVHCLTTRGDELWYCPGYISTTYELGRSTDDGLNFAPMLELERFRHGKLSVAECPGGALKRQCEDTRSDVEALLDQLDLSRGDAGATEDSAKPGRKGSHGGCALGSGTGSATPWWLALTWLGLCLCLARPFRPSSRSKP